jgi:hypothetical protein
MKAATQKTQKKGIITKDLTSDEKDQNLVINLPPMEYGELQNKIIK